MGIESDQLVFDYLSRVGDVAQQRQLPSGTRMRLVSGLRGEIDRRRAGAADSPAAVRRILDRLGSPDDLVDAAADNPDDVSAAIPDASDVPSSTSARLRRVVPEPGRLRRAVPRPRLRPAPARRAELVEDAGDTGGTGEAGNVGAAGAAGDAGASAGTARGRRAERPAGRAVRRAAQAPPPPPQQPAPAPPHLASTEELGDHAELPPDWWRVGGEGSGPSPDRDTVHGFTGGVEIPEMLQRPPSVRMDKPGPGGPPGATKPAGADEDEDSYDEDENGADGADGEGGAVEAAGPRRRFRPLPPAAKPPARRPAVPEPAPKGAAGKAGDGAAKAAVAVRAVSLNSPMVLLAAATLITGAVIGNWFALTAGWVVAWFSRKLSGAEKKVGVFVVPLLSIGAGVGWLWGRSQGKWGDPVVEGHMNEAVAETWPWVVRGAAVASALFLLWRSQRRGPVAEE
ncbi:hypothetical protein [Streptomyces silvensis]|uniref:Uncharacterized protein n=1 Tax=Streptomyces silvensis TaxID=1765722 RepID=A0A0W7XA74_9ACTN|nr:hypothetical protein [Streptomyces silvensis]KUF19757.1 hypothetical protein AT728_05250 [Streptomyces silvensis]